MIELDVQMTNDHRLVIFHDERLDRTTNGRGPLTHRRYRDLAGLDAGAWFAPRFAGERILLVSQALRLIRPPCRVNLELKRTRRPAALIHALVRGLRWTRAGRRVLVSSFEASLVARVRTCAPRLPIALLCRRRPWAALQQAVRLGCVAFHPH
jgi:glycerophosphoryl diester phosphodiesterase